MDSVTLDVVCVTLYVQMVSKMMVLIVENLRLMEEEQDILGK